MRNAGKAQRKASTSTDFQNFKNHIYLNGQKVTYQ